MRVSDHDRVTDVAGVTVGQHHRIDDDATVADAEIAGSGWATGSTVICFPDGATGAVDVRGGGPGTRETDLLDPANSVLGPTAIVLTGGSAYGLAVADGVMTELERDHRGLAMDAHGHVVPIVPAAVVFDLTVGGWSSRPDADFGVKAVRAAGVEVATGSVGAGAGARAGALKGGIGTAGVTFDDGPAAGITVAALMVANPVGSVIDPGTGLPWDVADHGYHRLTTPAAAEIDAYAALQAKGTVLNTTIGVVATDATAGPGMMRRVAIAAQDGIARAIRPAHLPLDGDTVFAVATNRVPRPTYHPVPPGLDPELAVITAVSAAVASVVQRAIVGAVLAATPVAGIPTFAQTLPSARRRA
ncbi:P1 family peptidase [Williamsia sterculiae]|uniref:P1 family peptidase n=1 Tax=Williamsia sterculiae TaxID=1344003 RepID=UPI000970E400|nr:P1 family peptidase [Williamsia sterculiae]